MIYPWLNNAKVLNTNWLVFQIHTHPLALIVRLSSELHYTSSFLQIYDIAGASWHRPLTPYHSHPLVRDCTGGKMRVKNLKSGIQFIPIWYSFQAPLGTVLLSWLTCWANLSCSWLSNPHLFLRRLRAPASPSESDSNRLWWCLQSGNKTWVLFSIFKLTKRAKTKDELV